MSKIAKKWVLVKEFVGAPKLDDFKLEEEEVSFNLRPGEIVIEALYLTVDPYMRIKGLGAGPGETIRGEQVARVRQSQNPDYPEGSLVLALCGWRTLTAVRNPEDPSFLFNTTVRRLPDLGDLPPSLGLGCLGMPGLTAIFSLLDKGQPQAGEVVLVSSAAGAVGSVVGQIAKIKGCFVIGSAGTKEKCDWLKELGFDHVFNYKTTPLDDALKLCAPNGIDLYFDNVGGEFAFIVLQNHMKTRGRVVAVGAISEYNDDEHSRRRSVSLPIIAKELTVHGFEIGLHRDRVMEGMEQLLQWIREGKLKYRETVIEGFERMPEAFMSLLQGHNTGKTVVRV